MKQVLQELNTGRSQIVEVPAAGTPRRGLCIVTRRSLISAGTERMLVEFSRAGWLDKARQQPEKVRQVLEKARTDGPLATLAAVRSALAQPMPLGYCNVGVVTGVGVDVSGFSVGDRVISNGPHAEVVAVPRNLCARIPDAVSDDAASLTVLGAIALQGMRLAAPTLGESFVVTGLGLIGLIAVQLLRAAGCRVLGIDPDPAKIGLARQFGAETVDLSRGEDPLAAAEVFSRGRGIDGALITAATDSNEPLSQAARMCRKRGRIVLVGVAGLQLHRAEFYVKELSFQVSCSYGPGRYDRTYEEEGQDYPVGFVRWTAQRNFEAVLDMMAVRSLDVERLITHRFAIEDAQRAYDLLASDAEAHLGIMLEYPQANIDTPAPRTILLRPNVPAALSTHPKPIVGVVGAGNYAGRILIPALAAAKAQLHSIASHRGLTAATLGRKFGFEKATTDVAALIAEPQIDTVVIATRHDSHARLVGETLAAGKHVFVEKPLAIRSEDLDVIENIWLSAADGARPLLMVGFNRRFAPQIVSMKSLLDGVAGPKTFIVTINAGGLPSDHWTQSAEIGGGRLIGEGCHFIDLLRFLAGAAIVRWQVSAMGSAGGGVCDDTISVTLSFADGSVGTLHYFANGPASFPKERIEVFAAGCMLQLDNFRRMKGYGWKGFGKMNLWRQDKGQTACVAAFLAAIRSGTPSPIPFYEIMEVSRVSIAIGDAARGVACPH